MSKERTEQRRITLKGRSFHFVSYEGQVANAHRQVEATAPAWFLMNGGKRWMALPHQPGQDVGELDRLLTEWLEAHVFAQV